MPAGTSAIVPLQNITLSSTASSVTFSSIISSSGGSTFRDLVVVMRLRGASPCAWEIKFNDNSTSTDYPNVYLRVGAGSFASPTFGAVSTRPGIRFCNNLSSGSSIINIMDYTSSADKNVLCRTGDALYGGELVGSRYISSSPITSISISSVGASMNIGSSFAIYGVLS